MDLFVAKMSTVTWVRLPTSDGSSTPAGGAVLFTMHNRAALVQGHPHFAQPARGSVRSRVKQETVLISALGRQAPD